MISYKKIGHFGRSGNQMFQFAATVGIARKASQGFAFPQENTEIPSVEDFKDGVRREVYFDLPKYFPNVKRTLASLEEIETIHVAQEPGFHFCKDFFTIPDQTNLQGYFQTEKYFEHCSDLIREFFEFNSETKKKAQNNFPSFPNDVEFVSIHLRRGDYIGLQQFHPIMDADYYFDAMTQFMDGNYCFLIFSDDIEYAKELFGDQDNIVYMQGNDPDVDMCAMSMCHHNVIANSSFSWWGAWLNNNPNKKVIAPKRWFGPAYKGVHDTKDLYPESWIIK
jgi:Glycosyl transferase family 11